MRSLSPDQLRALDAIARTGSFSAAAAALNLSQPAVSLQIRELEHRLGVVLVERMNRRAYPTPAGEELLEHARRVLAEIDEMLEAMRRHREGKLGRVRLGTSEAILTYMLPPLLREIRTQYPNLELVAMPGSTSRVLQRLLANELDIGLVTMPVDEPQIEMEFVREDQFYALFPPDETGLPEAMTPRALAQRTFIIDGRPTHSHRLIDGWFATAGLRQPVAMEIDNSESIKSMVAAGLGCAILPREAVMEAAAKNELLVRPLDPPLKRQIAIIRRRDKPVTRALQIVADALRSLAHREIPPPLPATAAEATSPPPPPRPQRRARRPSGSA